MSVHERVERRARRIERWLKRCIAACGSGAWSSALMEAECLEAETRGLREDMWQAAGEEAGAERRSRGARASMLLRVAAAALVMLVTLDLPLSLDQDRPFDPMGGVAVLTSSEAELLNALRTTLSSGNRGIAAITFEAAPQRDEVKASAPIRRTRSASAAEKKAVSEVQTVDTQAERPRELSVEDVLSLVQVGERALHISDAGVRVIP